MSLLPEGNSGWKKVSHCTNDKTLCKNRKMPWHLLTLWTPKFFNIKRTLEKLQKHSDSSNMRHCQYQNVLFVCLYTIKQNLPSLPIWQCIVQTRSNWRNGCHSFEKLKSYTALLSKIWLRTLSLTQEWLTEFCYSYTWYQAGLILPFFFATKCINWLYFILGFSWNMMDCTHEN